MYYYKRLRNTKEGEEYRYIARENPSELELDIQVSEEEYNLYGIPQLNEREVKELKKSLSDSDYKIIQCMEQFLVDNSLYTTNLPYDINELHAERQAARDRINEIE